MQLNNKWGKSLEDLKGIPAKTAKNLIKKDLSRLEKGSSAEKPVPIAILGEHGYPDKPSGIALVLIGNPKNELKKYVKEQLVQQPLGAVGRVYFGGIDQDGQKSIKIDLAKGKGKGKADKLARGLKKLIPQATYNVTFGEMPEDAFDALSDQFDQLPDEPETQDQNDNDQGEVDASGMDNQLLLDSNLRELSASLGAITQEIYPRLKNRSPQEGDADTLVDTLDLAKEWLELFDEANDDIKTNSKNNLARAKVLNIINQVEPMIDLLERLGETPTKAGNSAPAGNNASISASVGKGGKNVADDVRTVQRLLNGFGYNLAEDGAYGAKTLAAIIDFQTRHAGLPSADGRIDVGGTTWRKLSGNAGGNPQNQNQNQAPISGGGAKGAYGNTVIRKGNFVISLPPDAQGSYPLVLIFAGMNQKADAMMPHTPDAYFKEAIMVFATAADNFGPAQTAYAPELAQRGLSVSSISICGYSLGGQAAFRNYGNATKAVGLIDPTTYFRDLEKIDSKAVFSTYPTSAWNWSARKPGDANYLAMHAMRDGALLAQQKGGVGELTKVGHAAYPKYFLAKFKSNLI